MPIAENTTRAASSLKTPSSELISFAESFVSAISAFNAMGTGADNAGKALHTLVEQRGKVLVDNMPLDTGANSVGRYYTLIGGFNPANYANPRDAFKALVKMAKEFDADRYVEIHAIMGAGVDQPARQSGY